jgi:hypothetical protein
VALAGRLGLLGLLPWLALAAGGCAAGGRPPTARLSIAPAYVPLGDHYATEVQLDGSASRDEVDDPAGAFPLTFRWTVDDPGTGPIAPAKVVTVRVAGDHPTTVALTVVDRDGDQGTVSAQIGVTLP